MGTIVMLENVRALSLHVFEPKEQSNGDFKFQGHFGFDKSHPAMKKIEAAIVKEAQAVFGKNWKGIYEDLEATKKCLRNGDKVRDDDGETVDRYKGVFFVVAKNKTRPKAFDLDGQTKLSQMDGKLYSGCFVNASIEVYAMKKEGIVGVFANLRGVQFFADGDAFGGGSGVASDNEFTDLTSGTFEDEAGEDFDLAS